MYQREEFNEYLFFRAVEIYNRYCRDNENLIHWSDAQVFRDYLTKAGYRNMDTGQAVNAIFSVFDRHRRIEILQKDHPELFRQNVESAKSFSVVLDIPSISRDYQLLKKENLAIVSPYDPYFRNLDAVRMLGVELGVMSQNVVDSIAGGNPVLVTEPEVILNHYRISRNRREFVNRPDRKQSLKELREKELIDDQNWNPLLIYRHSELERNNYDIQTTPGLNIYNIRDVAGLTRLTGFMEKKVYQKAIRVFTDDAFSWSREENWFNPNENITRRIRARADSFSRVGRQLQYLYGEGYRPVFKAQTSGPFKGRISASVNYGLSTLELTVMDIDRKMNQVGAHVRKDGRNLSFTYASSTRTSSRSAAGSGGFEGAIVWVSPEESLDLLKFAMGRYSEMRVPLSSQMGSNRIDGKEKFKSYTNLRAGTSGGGETLITYRQADGRALMIKEDIKNVPVHMFSNDSPAAPFVYSNKQIYDRLNQYLKTAKEEFVKKIDTDYLYQTAVSAQKYSDMKIEPEYSQNTLIRKIQKSFYSYLSMKTDSFIMPWEIKKIEKEETPISDDDDLRSETVYKDMPETMFDHNASTTFESRYDQIKKYISLETRDNLLVQLFGSSILGDGNSADEINFKRYNSDNENEGRYLLNPALVAEHIPLQNGTGYGLKLDIMRMCKILGMKPKNLDRSNQDNIDLANELVTGLTDYENPKSSAMDMLHLQDPSTHKLWYTRLGKERQSFVNARIETVRKTLLSKGAVPDGVSPLAAYGINEAPHSMKIIMDKQGVVTWEADFITAANVDTAVKNVRDGKISRYPFIRLRGSIGQIAVPYINNMIKTPYISKEAKYLVPAYHATLAIQTNDGMPQRSVAELTRIDDYGSMLDAALTQSVSAQVAKLLVRQSRSHVYGSETYEEQSGLEKGTAGSPENLLKRNLTMDESTKLNKLFQKLDTVERLFMDQPVHDRMMNLSSEDRRSITEMQTSIIKYDTSLNQKAYLSAQAEQNGRFLDVSHTMTKNEFDKIIAADDSFFDQLVQIGNTPMSLLNIRGVRGRLDPILGGTGPQIGSERYLVKGAKIENRRIVPSEKHLRAPIYYVKGFENLKFDGVERQAIVAKEFTHCLSVDRNVRIAYGPLGGWNMEDAIVVSRKFAENHPVEIMENEEASPDLLPDNVSNGPSEIRIRPLKPGDKIDNGHGNKGVISIVVDPEMDLETAGKLGIEKLVQFFRDNPDLDMVCSSTTWTRNNVGGAIDGISKTGTNCADLIVRNDLGQPETVKGGMITNGTAIITDKTVDSGTHYHIDPNFDGRTGSRKGIFSISALEGYQMYETIRSFVNTNEREWDRTREYLMACGFFMDSSTKFSPVYLCTHGGAADRIPDHPVLRIEEYLHVSGSPLNPAIGEEKMIRAFHDRFSRTGGFIEVSLPLDYIHYKTGRDRPSLQTYPLIPSKTRPCQTDEEFRAAGFSKSGGAWFRDPDLPVSDAYPDGKVTYAFPVVSGEYRSGHLTESGSVVDSVITTGYLNLMREQARYVMQSETADLLNRISSMNRDERQADTEVSPYCRFSVSGFMDEQSRRIKQLHKDEIVKKQKAASKKSMTVDPWPMSRDEAGLYGIKVLTEITKNSTLMSHPHLFRSKVVQSNPWYMAAGTSANYQHLIAERFKKNRLKDHNPYSIASLIVRDDMEQETAAKIRNHSSSIQKRIFEKFTCKKNILKEQTFAPKANNTGFIIAVPDPRNRIDEVTLSCEVAETLGVHEGETVLCYRDPTWRSEGFWAADVRIDRSENAPGIGINPSIAQRPDADFDGDHIGVIKAANPAIEKEWKEKAMVHQHLVDMTRCTDDPELVSSVYTRYKKLERDYNAKTGENIDLPPFETVGGLSLNLGSDIALGMNRKPELKTTARELHADALVNHIAYEQQIRSREDFEKEACRIADGLNTLIQSAFHDGCGTNFLSFENTEGHLQSVYDNVLTTEMKGKEKDLVKYAGCLGRDIEIKDGGVIVRSRLKNMSLLPINSYDQNKTALLGLAMKTEAAGYAGRTGQTIQAPAASERRYEKATYLVNQVVQQLAQCNLQMKKTPEKAPASLFIIATALPDLLNGGPLKKYDEKQKLYVNDDTTPSPNVQQAIDCAYEMITSKNGLGLTVSREIFQMAMENSIVYSEEQGSTLNVKKAVGNEGLAYDLCYNFTDAADILTQASQQGSHLIPPGSRLNIFRPESDGRKQVSIQEDRDFLTALGLDESPESEMVKVNTRFENKTVIPKKEQLSVLIRCANGDDQSGHELEAFAQKEAACQETSFDGISYGNAQEEVEEILYPF